MKKTFSLIFCSLLILFGGSAALCAADGKPAAPVKAPVRPGAKPAAGAPAKPAAGAPAKKNPAAPKGAVPGKPAPEVKGKSAGAPAPGEEDAKEDDEDDEDSAENGEEAPAVDPNAWKAERDEIVKGAEQAAVKWVNANITPQKVIPKLAAALNKKWPGLKPSWTDPVCLNPKTKQISAPRVPAHLAKLPAKKQLEALRSELKEKLEQEYVAAHPAPTEEFLREEAAKKFPMYKKMERVAFSLRDGLGLNTSVEGVFLYIDSERIRIGNRTVVRKDLDEETEARFYKEKNEKLASDYIAILKHKYDVAKAFALDEQLEEQLPTVFINALFIPSQIRTDWLSSTKTERWMSRREFMQRAFDKNKAKIRERKIAQEIEKAFKAQEWEMVITIETSKDPVDKIRKSFAGKKWAKLNSVELKKEQSGSADKEKEYTVTFKEWVPKAEVARRELEKEKTKEQK